MKKPIVWTIAGSDSGGGAGIQADLHTFQALGVHGCSVITAVTAQNSFAVNDIHVLPAENVAAQINTLAEDLYPAAIKCGLLGDTTTLGKIKDFLLGYTGYVICDPVMITTSGANVLTTDTKDYLLQHVFPLVTLITPNIPETEMILGRPIKTSSDIKKAAEELLTLGVKNVLIKGGHLTTDHFSQDYWTNGVESFWLSHPRISHPHNHGSGCTLSAAITACLARGYELKDALVIGKMLVTQGIRLAQPLGQGPGAVVHGGWPNAMEDLPYLTANALLNDPPLFPDCGPTPLGLYPVIDSVEWLQRLLPLGVKTIQLRIKEKNAHLEQDIATAIQCAKKFQARLFINDYWQLAIHHGAYGVHLGQEDLIEADIQAIHHAGLRLGVSTHCYYEVAKAHAVKPSYIAVGPVFKTTSKEMKFSEQGLLQLHYWCDLLTYPVVAIGGINQTNIHDVLATGCDGVALIAAITKATDPIRATKELLTVTHSYAKSTPA